MNDTDGPELTTSNPSEPTENPAFRSGFAALVGRPNVGKSTLVNALVEYPVSIVSPRPQTTRHRILGIRTCEQYQLVFMDTPGVHRHNGSRAMNRYLNRTALS
ncbi:MAG: GTPase, partial [Pseudomonadota bacterium]